MPLYDYHCKACSESFELLLRTSETALCPHCGSTEVEKSLSLTAPPGRSAGLLAKARSQAAREGHFSHYSPAERPR